MEKENIWRNVGSYLVDLIWIILIFLTLFLSIKRKQVAWIVILFMNIIIGFYISIGISAIIPIIYLIVNRNFKKSQKQIVNKKR